jgi:hypothetical protein
MSGMSCVAGIPTGWEVVQDLARKVGLAKGADLSLLGQTPEASPDRRIGAAESASVSAGGGHTDWSFGRTRCAAAITGVPLAALPNSTRVVSQLQSCRGGFRA